ncbi:AarF/UbiB family protein [Candidatus Pelagibacter sp.]|nr:AarF/UbiB family protein [Candidatus Pelagibacter sp.]
MTKIFSKKELHLIIIWENGRYKEKEIIKSISEKFEFVEKYKVNWNKNLFGKNLTTFYGTNLPPNSNKEKHCGNGEFLLIIFYDKDPKYDYVKTNKGTEKVNINIFSCKEKFRDLTGGGHKIHSTNSPVETNHDLTLLLGINYNDYELLLKKNFNPNKKNENIIKNVPENIIGVNGWESLEQLFYVMNSSLDYVVMRNFEYLPENRFSKEHGDIDFLVKDLEQTVFIMNSQKLYKKRYKINVSGKDVLIDLEYVGDGSYDKKWQKNILEKKILLKNSFYVPELEDYFYSLIYHILVHKTYIEIDYPEKIKDIYKKFSFYDPNKCNFDNYLKFLEKFLSINTYQITKPKEPSFFFDEKILDYKKDIESFSKIKLKNIKPYLVNEWKNSSGFIYFKAETENKKKLFIKSRGIEESSSREYKVIKELRNVNQKYFPKEYYFKSEKDVNFIIMEEVEGHRLDRLINSNEFEIKPNQYKENLYNGIFNILKILHKLKIVHRDIRPQNLIIKQDGTPVLIDFQFVVDIKRIKYKEFQIVRKNPELIIGLGDKFAKNIFHWDDAYSVYKIFDLLKIKNDSDFIKIKNMISKMIGRYEIISVHNNFFSKISILAKNYYLPYIYKIKLIFYKILYQIISTDKHKSKITKFEKKLFYNLKKK